MENSIQVDGLKIRYLSEGRGAPVVLLHGASLGSSADVWEGTLRALAQGGFRGVAVDRPGYGLSDNPRDYGGSYQNSFVLKFMDALGLDRACLVGHSMTGSIVIHAVLEHPDRVIKAVTAGTGSLLPPLPDEGGRGRGEGRGEGEVAEPTLEDTKKLLEENLFDKSLITPEVLEKRHRMSVGKNFLASLERSRFREPKREEVPLWRRLEEIKVPLLMVYGTHDRGSAAKRCVLLMEKSPRLRIELVENAAHMVMWDANETFCRKLLAFLSEGGKA